MDEQELARLGHLNLIEFGRESSRWGRGGGLEEEDGVVLYATGASLPVLSNGAFRLDESVPADSVVAKADAWFGARGRGYTVQVRDTGEDDDLVAACEAAGLVRFGEGGPEMVCRTPVAGSPDPPGAELRVVRTEADVAAFAAVNANAYATYGMPPETAPDTFNVPGRLLASPHVHAVVAAMDGESVAAALTFLSHGIAGVYWVGTVDGARGRGLGEAVTRAVTNAAFDRGARANTLQASPMGEPIYRRMGYEPIHSYISYVRFQPPE